MISAVILTKNEENMIADCIESVKALASEIIVVDSYSTDRTVEIAEHLGATVFQNKFEDFSTQRSFGLKHSKNTWILYLDADERLSRELSQEIKSKIQRKELTQNAYKLKRKNFYFGSHEWPRIETLERLFKKEKLRGWYGELHESPRIDGEVGILENYLLHFTHRDITSMLEKTIEWSKVEAELRIKAHHPEMKWWRFPRVMMPVFFNYYILQKGWRAGTAGLVESLYQVFSIFITYARLWELQNKKK
jgi:glycosyltransferase involved in cell wall biosynthesis